jgi:glycosyltransferase involved in cell wall biosynthesis
VTPATPSSGPPKLLLCGIYPPPVGGVAIHIKRFVRYLAQRGVAVDFVHPNECPASGFPQVSPRELLLRALQSPAKIVHVHGFQHRGMHGVLILLALLGKKVVVTIHNEWFDEDYRQLRGVRRLLARLCFSLATRVIAVNERTDLLFVPRGRIVHIPAFLPPAEDELDPDSLPEEVRAFRSRFRWLITANAFRIWFRHGVDLYGLDLCVELMARLAAEGADDVGLLFVLADVGHPEHLAALQRRLAELGLQERVLFLTRTINYSALLRIADVFLRPTTSDGDAISLREALHLGVRAIASDVVPRPAGTLLFRGRDVVDLHARVAAALAELREGRRPEPLALPDHAGRVLEVYRELWGPDETRASRAESTSDEP